MTRTGTIAWPGPDLEASDRPVRAATIRIARAPASWSWRQSAARFLEAAERRNAIRCLRRRARRPDRHARRGGRPGVPAQAALRRQEQRRRPDELGSEGPGGSAIA